MLGVYFISMYILNTTLDLMSISHYKHTEELLNEEGIYHDAPF